MLTRDFYTAPVDINSKMTTISLMLIISVSYSFLLLMPAILATFVTELEFSGEAAGQIAFANMLGLAITSIFAFLTMHMWNLRVMTILGLCGLVFVDIGTAMTRDAETMTYVRFLAGLCTGIVAAAGASVASGTQKPERVFALLMVAQFVMSAIGFQLIPVLFASFGVRELFMILAVVTVCVMPMVRYFGTSSGAEDGSKTSVKDIITPVAVLGLISTLALYTANGGTWGFLELIGTEAKNVSPENIADALSLSMLVSILAAGFAAVLGLKFGRMIPLIAGVSLMSASIYAFNTELTGTTFIIYSIGFNSAFCFVAAYYLGFFAWLDPTGRLNAIGNFFVALGLALGPLMGGSLIAEDGSFTQVISAMAISCVTALVFIILSIAVFFQQHRSSKKAIAGSDI